VGYVSRCGRTLWSSQIDGNAHGACTDAHRWSAQACHLAFSAYSGAAYGDEQPHCCGGYVDGNNDTG